MKIIKQLLRGERGNIIVMTAMSMALLMGATALVVDAGYLYTQKRHLQNAADAAALAAAQELPWYNAAIETTARFYAEAHNIVHDPSSNTIVQVSNMGDSNKVEVVITNNYPLFFARAIGFDDADVSARAVATKQTKSIDLLPFLLIEYDGIIDDAQYDTDIWGDWENDKDSFYNVMSDIVNGGGITIQLWMKSNAGNWGIADMRDFIEYQSMTGNVNAGEIQYILKNGLEESFCEGPGKIRQGRPGYVSSIENSNPSDDGMKLSQRLARDQDKGFFIVLVQPGRGKLFQGNTDNAFGIDEFLIGYVETLDIITIGQKRMEGPLTAVYKHCDDIEEDKLQSTVSLME